MKSAASLARTAIIAALYAVCTVAIAPFSYGTVQFRIAECLCILAFFYKEAVVGLTVGCLIANIFSPSGAIDMVLGTFATLVAVILSRVTYRAIKNKTVGFIVGSLFPVIINALLVPIAILVASPEAGSYIIVALQVGFGEAVVIYTLGLALYLCLMRLFSKGVLKPEDGFLSGN